MTEKLEIEITATDDASRSSTRSTKKVDKLEEVEADRQGRRRHEEEPRQTSSRLRRSWRL